MTELNLELLGLKTYSASFVADDQPDMKVTVNLLPDGSGAYIISVDGVGAPASFILPAGFTLQMAEALQFVADTLGSTVPGRLSPFVRGWVSTAADINHTAKTKGFWDTDRNNGEMIALIHSELSEALEALRINDPPDDKIPEFSSVETELADAVIRIMDMAHARGWRVAQAIEAKMKFNATRPYKHGKGF